MTSTSSLHNESSSCSSNSNSSSSSSSGDGTIVGVPSWNRDPFSIELYTHQDRYEGSVYTFVHNGRYLQYQELINADEVQDIMNKLGTRATRENIIETIAESSIKVLEDDSLYEKLRFGSEKQDDIKTMVFYHRAWIKQRNDKFSPGRYKLYNSDGTRNELGQRWVRNYIYLVSVMQSLAWFMLDEQHLDELHLENRFAYEEFSNLDRTEVEAFHTDIIAEVHEDATDSLIEKAMRLKAFEKMLMLEQARKDYSISLNYTKLSFTCNFSYKAEIVDFEYYNFHYTEHREDFAIVGRSMYKMQLLKEDIKDLLNSLRKTAELRKQLIEPLYQVWISEILRRVTTTPSDDVTKLIVEYAKQGFSAAKYTSLLRKKELKRKVIEDLEIKEEAEIIAEYERSEQRISSQLEAKKRHKQQNTSSEANSSLDYSNMSLPEGPRLAQYPYSVDIDQKRREKSIRFEGMKIEDENQRLVRAAAAAPALAQGQASKNSSSTLGRVRVGRNLRLMRA
jgi:hypothetical protein